MSTIHIMKPTLANMIAAGEVVDRPASVIKELIENAIDAKSSTIKVEVFDMGMKEIIVTDNGSGMDLEDAKLAFLRHATSKISEEEDLNHILSLGFRGEALAAIASVSKVTLKTRREDADGVFVVYEGGQLISEGLAATNIGTSISVKDLFYNTPARFKYIKSEFAERQAIIDLFDHLALAHPEVAFSLYIDQKLLKETYGNQNIEQLIYQIYGQNLAKGLLKASDTIQKIEINAYLFSPEHARSKKKDITLIVNGRYIKNYRLIQAVIDGYHSRIMVGKYPMAMLYLEMDPSLIDVNVHPQKYEVKFVNEFVLAFLIEDIIKRTLTQKTQEIPAPYERVMKDETYIQESLFIDEHVSENLMKSKVSKIPEMDYVGTFSGTYLIFQNEDGLFLVDQHAAQERIRYEYYMETFKNPVFATKPMLFSKPLNLSPSELLVLKEKIPCFSPYGFSFNENLELITIPTWLKDGEIDLAIESMIHMLLEKQQIDLSILRDDLAKDVSCKGAIKANKPLNLSEIHALMERLKRAENPYTCPHGRPTIIKLTHYEIERMFKRVVS
ncbi:MAG: DNA mismatch repair endonuclease MutL [Acholeplasmataceae bacterium]|nr:DNA mismatch repair endonuclease MutL [Acholeplasmataceae bacterium]MDD4193720.1 DNA mismatch repair endonuclease MutL [Acholeplasmataceae bacterium]